MAYQKAKIKVYGEKSTKLLPVLFNPAEYSLTDGANYAEQNIPGLEGPVTQFISGASTQLKMTLHFDTYQTPASQATANVAAKMDKSEVKPTDVSKLTREIVKLTAIEGSLHRPPLVEFIWGAIQFKGVIKEVNSTYTMFLEDGMPVRARLELTFQSVTDPTESKRKSPFESPDRTKYRVIEQGTQLWHIAWEEYGDPELWRVIAEENKLMNPRNLTPGQMIRLPAL